MADERCETCRFFIFEKASQKSYCRRFPPQTVYVPTAFSATSFITMTQPENWCGEYQRKEAETQ